jgi:ABC-type cobalamin/Fe3+-siderophores transport system ATPase subunit
MSITTEAHDNITFKDYMRIGRIIEKLDAADAEHKDDFAAISLGQKQRNHIRALLMKQAEPTSPRCEFPANEGGA